MLNRFNGIPTIHLPYDVVTSLNYMLQSGLDSTRGSGVPDFKKFSAYNRGPRSKEVDQILTSIYSFTAKVVDIGFGERTTLTY
jgi:hypothetical protein